MSDGKVTEASNYRLPSDITLKHAAKLAIVEDKPIMLDYWSISLDKKALVGVKENGEKLGTSETELERVMVHGLLHLLGYKDKKKEDKALMTEKEDYYIKQY